MSYEKLYNLGSNLLNSYPIHNNDPISLCVGTSNMFKGGDGQNSLPCQVYMSQRCAKQWDVACEDASKQNGFSTAVFSDGCGIVGMNEGDLFVRNTAMEKYRTSIRTGENWTQKCKIQTEQFDPLNPSSPCMTYFVGDCVGDYSIDDPKNIDSDPVMNKMLDNPGPFLHILKNIKNTMVKMGTLCQLEGTRLGNYYRFHI